MNQELPKFSINYIKTKSIDLKTLEDSYTSTNEDQEFDYNPFSIRCIQNYNPIYNEFFELNDTNYNTISLNHKFHFLDTSTVLDIGDREPLKRSVFIKYSPLLDPYRFMTGKYKNSPGLLTLPAFKEELYGDEKPIQKIIDYNNASYIDNFFCFLTSMFMHQHQFIHGVDYYGSWLGIQDVFKVNVSDDIEFLQSSDYFLENLNKHFFLTKSDEDEFLNIGSRSNKIKLNILNNSSKHNISLGALEIIEDIPTDMTVEADVDTNNNVVYEKELTTNPKMTSSSDNSDDSDDSDDDNDDNENSSEELDDNEEEEKWETESETESEVATEDINRFAFIKNFPIQLICLERCDGTMDELFVKNEMNSQTAASALFQVIMSLIVYQKSFHFTHNDLHTNNIMFSNTTLEFIYYRYKKKLYKVPTYGKIFKIIDFGRSIYKFNGQIFCSDSFGDGGDASTQYNTEPYMNENKPRLDPNYSFDLCRLGCSIYDFIIDDDDPRTVSNFDEMQKTVYRWCTNDQGKNVLYKRNGEERYPNFKLYKMIARTVHQHTPEEQLTFPFFQKFLVKKLTKNAIIMDIDILPCYAGKNI
jgi:hypothetical protein